MLGDIGGQRKYGEANERADNARTNDPMGQTIYVLSAVVVCFVLVGILKREEAEFRRGVRFSNAWTGIEANDVYLQDDLTDGGVQHKVAEV